jgi:hypothetical protein
VEEGLSTYQNGFSVLAWLNGAKKDYLLRRRILANNRERQRGIAADIITITTIFIHKGNKEWRVFCPKNVQHTHYTVHVA